MINALAHRGPDDEGIYVDTPIALGNRRLAIIDLSAAGHQPMSSKDGRYTIVYNGELYNYKDIKKSLPDYPFQTQSDTEVILAGWQRWGKECLQQFNGMFAFAIWDNKEKELCIVRDRLGIKPLYYYQKDDVFVFASELRALLASNLVPRKLNKKGLVDYLRYQTVHAPETIIFNVNMLLPGHYLTISKNKFAMDSYWHINNISSSSEERSYQTICKDIKELLLNAVKSRLISDVPFGAFLSGGIDSSAVVALMSEVSSRPVKTFSVVFDESEYSEAQYSRLIAQKYKTEHHEIRLTPENFLEQIPDALKAMDHPSGDGPNTYIVSKATKEAGITMALSGLGGDELFAGYDIFRRSSQLEKYKWLWATPMVMRKAIASALKQIKPGISSEKISQLLSLPNGNFIYTYPIYRQVLSDQQIGSILDFNILPENVVARLIKFEIKNYLLSQVSIAEISTYMQNVLLRDTDQMSMAHALEVRVPFLDHHLVEYVLAVNDKYKYPHFPKKLLVDSLGVALPSEIVHRPKMGFVFPWERWLKNELSSFAKERIKSLSQRNDFNPSKVLDLWEKFQQGDPMVTWSRIWILIVLENWLIENKIES